MPQKPKKESHTVCWEPRYTLTSLITRYLMNVESAKVVVEHTPLSPAAAVSRSLE